MAGNFCNRFSSLDLRLLVSNSSTCTTNIRQMTSNSTQVSFGELFSMISFMFNAAVRSAIFAWPLARYFLASEFNKQTLSLSQL